jgi:hypothetical protein
MDWEALVVSVLGSVAITYLLMNTTFAEIRVIGKEELPLYLEAARRTGCKITVHRSYVGLGSIDLKSDEVCVRYSQFDRRRMDPLVRKLKVRAFDRQGVDAYRQAPSVGPLNSPRSR